MVDLWFMRNGFCEKHPEIWNPCYKCLGWEEEED